MSAITGVLGDTERKSTGEAPRRRITAGAEADRVAPDVLITVAREADKQTWTFQGRR
ncbi:hypothetical protein [Nonomuraea cavernae]|uniref:Uncharacterized protein n=1 Tax=Nonomuraea cavernae TaxID=2045107 RepID=A0A917ZCG6_9ACTN|nr:hypothetical protein [Nonomuraea cavernae]MCA2187158.1 hypothetical protein [Nonomuraea cavernae]GGO79095.1 hypothetical protein GCM10012289_62610 [Nonomuraea cavernae]